MKDSRSRACRDRASDGLVRNAASEGSNTMSSGAPGAALISWGDHVLSRLRAFGIEFGFARYRQEVDGSGTSSLSMRAE